MQDVLAGNVFNGTLYSWSVVGDLAFEVGFLIDSLTAPFSGADFQRTL